MQDMQEGKSSRDIGSCIDSKSQTIYFIITFFNVPSFWRMMLTPLRTVSPTSFVSLTINNIRYTIQPRGFADDPFYEPDDLSPTGKKQIT